MERFKTLGQLERHLIAYMEQHECTASQAIKDNHELICEHTCLFRLSSAEAEKLNFSSKESAKIFILESYLNDKLLYYKSCRSINAYKKYVMAIIGD